MLIIAVILILTCMIVATRYQGAGELNNMYAGGLLAIDQTDAWICESCSYVNQIAPTACERCQSTRKENLYA